MKKLSFLFFALLAVTLFTACGNDDEPDNKQTYTSTINSRAIDGDEVVFSQGNAKVELNYTDMFIKFTAEYKDANGQTHTLTTPDMKLYPENNSVYSFNNMASSTYTGIDMLEGHIDMGTGMMWYTFNTGTSQLVSTTHLLYAYVNTTITNLENGNHGTHQQSAYLFALDAQGETCIMQITNFISNLNGAVEAAEVQYNGLNVTPTKTGYRITADKVESSYNGFYILTDVDFTIDNQCQRINGSFMSNGLKHVVDGGLFSYN